MTRKKNRDNSLEGAEAEIKLALHKRALTGGNKKKKQ